VHVPAVAPRKRVDLRERLALHALVLLNGVCLAVLGWGVYAQLVRDDQITGKLLHIAAASSKLNRTSAEPVSLEIAAAMKTQEPVERKSAAPPTMSGPPAPLFAEPPPLGQVDSIPLALDWEPIWVFSSNHAHHQGDSPMLRNWKSLELAALLAAAFTAQPVVFAGGEAKKDDLKEILKRLDGIDSYLTKDLGKIFEKIGKDYDGIRGDVLKSRVDLDKVMTKVDTLEDKLDKLHADLDKLKKRGTSEFNPIDKASLDEIKSRLMDIEKSITKIQGSSRIALSPANTGRIQLMNMYPEELLFVINGKNYRVEANRTMFLENHPAGTFTYEVIAPRVYGLITRKTTSLDPNETFTITAR
jgi:tetrahydromethanopterin S-methyltransferase subunit G